MPAPTVAVTVILEELGGPAIAGVVLTATLDVNEVYDSIVIAKPVKATTDANGTAVLNLFPNAPAPTGLGTQGSTYRVTASIAGGRPLDVRARVPNQACNLHEILVLDDVRGMSDVELAALQAQQHSIDAGDSRDEAEQSEQAAGNSAISAAVSLAGVTAAMAIILGLSTTATAQASLAQQYAAQAASVVQQDLSGVAGAALHRSPNAIVATAFYNAANDSDGGAWTERAHLFTSWGQRALNGAWLTTSDVRGFQSELGARLSAATLGPELIDTANTAAAWASIGAGTQTIAQDGAAVKITGTSGTGIVRLFLNAAGGLTADPVANAPYRIVVRTRIDASGGAYNLAFNNSAANDITVVPNNGQWQTYVFNQIPTNNQWDVRLSSFPTGCVAWVEIVSVKAITGATAPSGSFYQLSTDGKYYRLWKNLLKATSNLNDPAWNGSINITATPGQTDPDGGATATRLTATGANGNKFQAITTGLSSLRATHSMWIRRVAGTGIVRLQQADGITVVDITATLDGTWKKFTAPASAGTGGSHYSSIIINTSGDAVDVAFPQMELGEVATAFEAKGLTEGTQTETFDGNKAKFPKQASIVAEAARVVIYDLTEPGRPMWMVFNRAASLSMLDNVHSFTGIAAREGRIAITSAGGGMFIPDFLKDTSLKVVGGGLYTTPANIAQRNSVGYLTVPVSGNPIPTSTYNAVAMYTAPDAPVDPVTGLQVPTIAVATAGGGAIIKNDGTAVCSASGQQFWQTSFNSFGDVFFGQGNANAVVNVARRANSLGAAFAMSTYTYNVVPAIAPQNFGYKNVVPTQGSSFAVSYTGAGAPLAIVRENPATPAAGLVANIAPTYNTGWMTGDIRRALLCDVTPGIVNGVNLVTNGTFDVDTSGWAPNSGNTTISQVAGRLRITNTAGGFGFARQALTTVPGIRYFFNSQITQSGGTLGTVWIGTTPGGFDLLDTDTTASGSFVAVGTTTHVSVGNATSAVGAFVDFDNITIIPVVSDRSYKAKHLGVFGTLTKTAVAAGAQLVAYSGFSAADYLREAYSADLDFGATGFSAKVWVNFTTVGPTQVIFSRYNGATGAYIQLTADTAGRLQAGLYDGATTRNALSSASFAGAGWVLVEMNYAPSGTLTLKVNARPVAVTTGQPLASLSNATATLTIGTDSTAVFPFLGSLTMFRIGATVGSDDAEAWAYEQEKQMFRAGAQITLPDSGSVLDIAWDERLGLLRGASAANDWSFSGLVRVESSPAAAGSITKVSAGGGLKLVARTTTNPGVDVTIPAQNLKEELLRDAERAAQAATARAVILDWAGGFTANTTINSALVTVTGNSLVYPAQATIVGARVTGTGIPANTRVLRVSGTTVELSNPCTATNSGVAVSFKDIILPPGHEVLTVRTGGTGKQEGVSKDFQRTFDGFREGVTYTTEPGSAAWLQVEAQLRRAA